MSNRQPNSRHCFVCGLSNSIGLHLRFDVSAPGEVTAECILSEKYQGYPGVVHGGIVAAMLDEIAGRANMGDGNQPRFMYTARLEIRYRKNVPIGQPLRLIGRAGINRGRTATATSAIYDQSGHLLADCKTLLVDVPSETLQDVDMQALGWKVYEDNEIECKQ